MIACSLTALVELDALVEGSVEYDRLGGEQVRHGVYETLCRLLVDDGVDLVVPAMFDIWLLTECRLMSCRYLGRLDLLSLPIDEQARLVMV